MLEGPDGFETGSLSCLCELDRSGSLGERSYVAPHQAEIHTAAPSVTASWQEA